MLLKNKIGIFASLGLLKALTFLFVGVLFISPSTIRSQCFFEGPFIIEDLSNNFITLEIEGALNNDLADPLQGVCGIIINFRHATVGDLLITLTSPAGNEIILVGSTVPPPPFTNGANWNITFLPCNLPATPDPGIPAQWSNNSPWANFGSYIGSYYPFSGCLESFDVGPVNGSWVLYIQDGLEFDEGVLLEFSILFCDPVGIECQTCEPDGGFLSGIPYNLCQGEQILGDLPDPDYLFSNPPDTALYDYHYLVVFEDSIVGVLPDPLFTFDEAGFYRIYGLSIASRDTNWLDSLPGQYLFQELNALLNTNPGLFCGDIGLSWVNVFVHPVYDIVSEPVICPGEVYLAGDSVLNLPGTYFFEFTTAQGCDSIVTIHLRQDTILALAFTSDTLSCVFPEVILDASASVLPDSGFYFWHHSSEGLLGDTNEVVLSTDLGGLYYFIIESPYCLDTAELFLFGSVGGTPFELVADTLDCMNDEVYLMANPQIPLQEYRWTGPNGFNSSESQVMVDAEGWYFFSGIDRDSCMLFDSILVVGQYDLPVLITDTVFGICEGSEVVLLLPEFDSSYHLMWVYLGDSLEGSNPVVSNAGNYQVMVRGENGCLDSFEVLVNFTDPLPEITYIDTPFSCEFESVSFSVFSDVPDSEFFWTDSMGFTDTGQTVDILFPGLYFLEVITPAGCRTDTTIEIVSQGNLPVFSLSLADSSGCFRDSLQIISQSSFSLMEFNWSGPAGYASEEGSPWVYQEGWYFVEVTTAGGCEFLDSIFILNDFDVSEIEISSDSLDCRNPIGELRINGPDDYVYTWTYPDLSENEGRLVEFTEPGLYRLLILNPDNFCTATLDYVTYADFSPPSGDYVADTLTCQETETLVIFLKNEEVSATFSGPGLISFSDTSALVNLAGEYLLVFEGLNGCMDSVLVQIEADTTLPQIALSFADIDCSNDSVSLSFQSDRELFFFNWSGPQGFYSEGEEVSTDLAGTYSFFYQGLNMCADTLMFIVEDQSESLNIVFSGDTNLNCAQTQTTLGMLNAGINYQFNWLGPDGFNSSNSEIDVNSTGWYYVTVTDENDCLGTDSIFVTEDFELPSVSANISEINCLQLGQISLIYSGNQVFEWTGPGGFSSDEDEIISDVAGEYLLRMTAVNGCFIDTTFILMADTTAPDIAVNGPRELNCDQSSVILEILNPNSQTNYLWLIGGDTLLASQISIETAGVYNIIATAANGCVSTAELVITEDFDLPEFSFSMGNFNCGSSSVSLNVETEDDIRSVSWFGPGGIFGAGEQAETFEDGAHLVLVVGANGCLDSLNFTVAFEPDYPEFILSYTEISCAQPTAVVGLLTSEENSFVFTYPNGEEESENAFMTDIVGDYSLVVTSPNDCAVSENFTILADTMSPNADIRLVSGFDCENSEAVLEADNNGESNIDFLWLGPMGGIVGDSTSAQLRVARGGIYVLNLINNDNGCEGEKSYELDEFERGQLLVELEITQPDCRNLPMGRIEVTDLSGDFVAPFEFSLGGGPWQFESIFNPGPGDWQISIKDSRACVLDTLIHLQSVPDIDLFIGEDTIVELGESIRMIADLKPDDLDYFYFWQGPVDCFDCIEVMAIMEQDELFVLEVEEVVSGCRATAERRVEVTADPRYYIPNVFHPRSLVGNNSFRVYSNSGFIAEFAMEIYDRWGSRIFEIQRCPASEECSWDGTFNGDEMPQGVYLYKITITTIRGEEIISVGEVLLLN